jgi:hypothetical protein
LELGGRGREAEVRVDLVGVVVLLLPVVGWARSSVQGVEGGVLRGGDVEAEVAGAAFFVEGWMWREVWCFL